MHGGATSQVQLRPLPPKGAFGQLLVVKGAVVRSQWAPKLPHAPQAPKAPEGNFCPLYTPTLSLNQDSILGLSCWGKEHCLGDFNHT